MKIALLICSVINGIVAIVSLIQGKPAFEPLVLSLLFSISAGVKE